VLRAEGGNAGQRPHGRRHAARGDAGNAPPAPCVAVVGAARGARSRVDACRVRTSERNTTARRLQSGSSR
jgi:hypothetical protein